MTSAKLPMSTSGISRRPFATVPSLLVLLAGGLLIAGACGDTPAGLDDPTTGEGSVEIRTNLRSPTVSTLVTEVTASDLADPLLFNLELTGTDTDGDGVDDAFSASDALTVPAGGERRFEVRAFDGSGIRTHEGSSVMDVHPGPNASAVVVTLNPLTGERPITVVLGSFDVTVTPETATIDVGGTRQYTAEVTDEDGAVDGAGPRWATSNPGVASVNATGLATGKAEGTARIAATWMGVGGEAALTVSGGTGSPSRSRIAFQRTETDVTGTIIDQEILVVEVDASGAPVGSPVEVTSRDATAGEPSFFGEDAQPTWSPDGSLIAFTSGRTGSSEIWVVEVDASGAAVGSPAQVTARGGAFDLHPAWSPDGGRIAFASQVNDGSGSRYDLWTIAVDASGSPTEGAMQLTASDSADFRPGWSPGGGHIAFMSGREVPGIGEIWVVEVDGAGAPVGIPASTTLKGADPAWSPDGTRVAFAASGAIWTVAVTAAGVPTETPLQLTSSGGTDRHPAWSPDGSAVAFTRTDAEGNDEIWTIGVDGAGAPSGSPVQVTTDPAGDAEPAWTAF